MRIGRNFTNLLNSRYLASGELDDLKHGRLSVADMDARVRIEAKADIVGQVTAAAALGLTHIELDGSIPNPYLELPEERLEAARSFALRHGITLSFHVPCSYVAAATASPQEKDRLMAVSLVKEYIDLAGCLGCINVTMHPGTAPRYQTRGLYRDSVRESVIRSLSELAPHAAQRGITLHMENNTAYEDVVCEVEECVGVIEAVRRQGGPLKFCFDAAHWLCRDAAGFPAGGTLESAVERIPEELLRQAQVHLHDYVPRCDEFHTPLHYRKGLLQGETFCGLLKKLSGKGVSIVIIETVARTTEEVFLAGELMREEQAYVEEKLAAAG